jgi:hypothetical protein
MPVAKKVRALARFTTWGEDEHGHPVEVTVEEGEERPVDDPIVEGHRDLFQPAKN